MLLKPGNKKTGEDIWTFSLPAGGVHCPGATSTCLQHCYALRMAQRRPLLGQIYADNLRAANSERFVGDMIQEAVTKRVIRVHASGEFYSLEYIDKWMEIARRTPGTLFYAYTRAWTIPTMDERLQQLGSMPNFKMLWSCDRETGVPYRPDIAYMSTGPLDLPARKAAIVFRTNRRSVAARMNGDIVCPAENGIRNQVTCAKCRLCFKEKL
jgi:hypothetical protein